MIDGRRTYAVANGYYRGYDESGQRREPRIHYDDRKWSKESSGLRNGDPKQSALVVMAASLFGISVVAGTVLFAYYILSCYGIY